MPTRTVPAGERRDAQAPVARLIRQIARDRGIALSALAARIGMTEQSLHNKLRGKAPLEIAELKRIALVLEVRPALLVTPPSEVFPWAARDSNPEPAEPARAAGDTPDDSTGPLRAA